MENETQCAQGQPADNPKNWERGMLEKIALAGLHEQRKARRWGIVFKSLTFGYLFIVLLVILLGGKDSTSHSGKHTALVDLQGVIAEGADASADNVVAGLRAAFESKGTVGVILRINSPGGSPVQAGYINDEIQRLRTKYPKKKLYAVVSDLCASGGYYVAVAADEIYVDKASLVGSIGVRMDSFGFVDALKKLGVERRLLTAGDHKGMLDPFLPVDAVERQRVQEMLDSIHTQFINVVKEGRGDRLKNDPQMFSGMFWSGEEALKLGLADKLGSAGYVAREVIGEEEIVDFTPKKDFFDRLAGQIGSRVALSLSSALVNTQLR